MCYNGWSAERKGVLQLYYEKNSFGYVCTGSLVMDQNSSYANWLLTADHCISNQTVASTLIAFFNYTTNTCNGSANSMWSYPSVSGSTYRVSESYMTSSDFSLLELNDNPPDNADANYLGWTTLPLSAGQSIAGIHHPDGAFKRISFGYEDEDVSTTNDFWDVIWTDGSTESGSSGSPLLTVDSKQIVGTLHGGYASCSAMSDHDWYGRFSVSWSDGLSDYLGNGTYARPSRPTVVASDGAYTDRVQVSWNAVSGATSYQVYRCTSSSISSCGGPFSDNASPYDDTGVTLGTTYYYRLKACNSTGCSNFSDYNTGYSSVSPPTSVQDDFGGDGKADILIRHSGGQLYLYEMNGSTRTGSNIGALDTAWTVRGIGDLGGDGRADIVLRNTSGQLYLYEMDGNVKTGSNIGALSTSWTVERVADYGGDGKAEILLRNSSGQLYLYEMDGNIVTGSNVGALSTSWTVQ
jgi:hypothetical protein